MSKLLTDVVKEYTHSYKVVVYRSPIPLDREDFKPGDQTDNDNIERSVRRSRTIINDYVLTNPFDLFATFTFDPKKVDRYSKLDVYKKMQGWLNRQKKQHPDFGYIIVPEKHQDGAYHFHALLNCYGGELTPTNIYKSGKLVYNMPGFSFGYTVVTKLDDDQLKTVAYMCKYITKDMETTTSGRRYWASRSLQKPKVYHNQIYDLGLAAKLDPRTIVYETDFNVIYHIDK